LSELADTDRMLALLDNREGAELIMEFLADMGGDPEDYGVEELAAVTPEQFGVGFKEFLQVVALRRPELTSLVASEDVDWARVVSHLESNLSQFLG
jgi:hypothetical protein